MLTLTKSNLVGSVKGRSINGMLLARGAVAAPPPGEYDLLPPLIDPVFGSYVIAVRRGSGASVGYVEVKRPADPGAAPSWDTFKLPAARMIHWKLPAARLIHWKLPAGAAVETVFVLSKQPIPGLNCVVLVSGYSDLLDALAGEADAVLTVN
jgi:hypothetical protein